jgi:predicted AlkP superfamily phosphohydrolase/phosphomutase
MRTVILGFDAFDPVFFEKLLGEGKTPHLAELIDRGGYSRFRVTNPPQSEVSWTGIATGLDPGGHGIFDFVHRNPETYALQVSLLPTQKNILGIQFVPPHNAQTIFDEAVQDGYPATSLWWPATFPAKIASPVRTIPGLGAPDIFGRLGVGVAYSVEYTSDEEELKTHLEPLVRQSSGQYSGRVDGPLQKTLTSTKQALLDFQLSFQDENSAQLSLSKQKIDLKIGEWSPIFEITFKVGFGISIKAVTRALLVKGEPSPELYFLPLQAHPLHAPWPYATPKGFVKKIWKDCGPFLTLGWPQDTTGLEEGFITDDQFLDLCDQIFEERKCVFLNLLNTFNEGVLACVFDTLDRLQHMFWKDNKDVIETWYIKLDELVGEVQEWLNARTTDDIQLLIVSDHGFGNFDYKVHINRWLIDRGYLIQSQQKSKGDLKEVDWGKSRAYALGLNSIYLNLEGREGQGFVTPSDKLELIQTLKDEFLQWKGPDGGNVVQNVYTQDEVFNGPLAGYGPDLIIGYHPGYRASSETGLGQWGEEQIEINNDYWNADHCFSAEAVPGVLISNSRLDTFPEPSFEDFPALAIGKSLGPSDSLPPPSYSDEDQEAVEKRLKDLGYL